MYSEYNKENLLPDEFEDEIPKTEIEIALSKAHKEMLKRMDLQLKIDKVLPKLQKILDYMAHTEIDLLKNDIREIINDLKL